jgi:hypothetical protein
MKHIALIFLIFGNIIATAVAFAATSLQRSNRCNRAFMDLQSPLDDEFPEHFVEATKLLENGKAQFSTLKQDTNEQFRILKEDTDEQFRILKQDTDAQFGMLKQSFRQNMSILCRTMTPKESFVYRLRSQLARSVDIRLVPTGSRSDKKNGIDSYWVISYSSCQIEVDCKKFVNDDERYTVNWNCDHRTRDYFACMRVLFQTK